MRPDFMRDLSYHAAMGWESVESLPGERRGGAGAFRGQAEPVVAERGAPSPRERLVLFWRSTPELTYRRSAKRLVLTPSYLYVERLDSDLSRVRRGALRGRRLDRGRVVYGIVDGEDLALLPRAGCEVTDALEAQLRGESEPLEPIAIRRGHEMSVMGFGAALACAWAVSEEYSMTRALSRIHDGYYTSEVVLSLYGVVALVSLGLAILLAAPVRIRIDAIGVHIARGIFPWLYTLVEPETLRIVVARPLGQRQRGGTSAWAVTLVRTDRKKRISVETFRPDTHGEHVRRRAVALGERLGKLLDREVDVRG